MSPTLGVIAGRGRLPRDLVAAARSQGRRVFVLALEGQTDPETLDGVDHTWIGLGAVGAGLSALKREGVEEIVLAGGVRRPSLKSLRPDLTGARLLARVGRKALGDDGLLREILAFLEEQGLKVVAPQEVLGELLAPAGCLSRRAPSEEDEADIARGFEVAAALGGVDVGQGVVVQQGIVLAVEAIEGTDRMLARAGELRRAGGGGVLVKRAKPGQESRVDLPAVGPETVHQAAAAGLAGVACEAGRTLLLDRDAAAASADELGVFLVGRSVP